MLLTLGFAALFLLFQFVCAIKLATLKNQETDQRGQTIDYRTAQKRP